MKNNTERVIYSKYYMDCDTYRIEKIDDEFTRMLGYTIEDILENQYTLFDLVPREDLAAYRRELEVQFAACAKGEEKAYVWHRMSCKDGSYVFVFCFGETVTIPETDEKKIAVLITDTTSIHNLKKEVIEKNVLLEELLNNMSGGAGVFDIYAEAGERYITSSYCSHNILEVYSGFDLLCKEPMKVSDFYKQYVSEEDIKRLGGVKNKKTGDDSLYECRLKRKDGSYTWVAIRNAVLSKGENRVSYITLVLDITQRKEEEQAMQLQNELIKLCVEASSEQIFDYNLQTDCYTLSELVEGELKEVIHIDKFIKQCEKQKLVHPEDKKRAKDEFERLIREKGQMEIQLRMQGEHGNYIWMQFYGVSLEDNYGKIYRIVGKGKDITDEKLRQQELQQQAERDALTGIYNNASMMKYVYANVCRNLEGQCAILVLDVDDFKMVNDAWGHEAGNQILTKVGRTLRAYVQEIGLAGRIGGDEFIVFLYQVAGKDEVIKHMSVLRDKMIQLSDRMNLTMSIGAAISERVSVDVQRLYKEADLALYAAKRRGGDAAILFDKDEIENEQRKHSEGGVYVEEEDIVLNETSDGVYVTDIETHEILYMNDTLYNAVRRRKGDFDWKECHCYEVLYDRHYPCEFCNMHQLKKHESLYWQRKNELNNRQYVCKDTLINWEGKRARLEVVYDVTTPTDMLHALERSLGSNDTLRQCVSQMSDSGIFRNSYRNLLRFVCKYYGAESTSVFEVDEDGEIKHYNWLNERSKDDTLRKDKKCIHEMMESLKKYANKQGIVILDNVVQYEQKDSELYNGLAGDKLWTVYAHLLKKGENVIGCLAVANPKQHVGDVLLLKTISAFLSNELIRRQIWEKQEYELTHDPQTGVYNRSCYMNRMADLADAESVGLAMVDVNNMKRINNDFGMERGNRVVAEIADILKTAFGQENIYRFHSDDFAILCLDETRDEFAGHVEQARAMLAEHEAGACIGYVWDDFDMDIRKMTEHAEEILKLEKQKFHESNADDPKYRHEEIAQDIKNKIASGYFKVYLQPKICMTDKSYYGAEALIRAVDAEQGLISPGRFIPVLEKTGTIEYIDFFVFEEVCKLIKDWQTKGIPLIPISFNFSRLTLLGSNLIQRVEEIVEKYQVPKNVLEIEITETIGDLEYDMIARIASGLRRAGYRLSMDDFGAKYSSISTLSIMKFDILKIDRSMVNTLEENEISRKVMNHVIAMCQDLGIECVAEGVETEEQAKLLQNMDCAIAQGYLYGKPMPIEEYAEKYKASLHIS